MIKKFSITYSLVFYLFVLANNFFPQVISGKIFDDRTNEPLIGANIFIEETSTGTTSDTSGNFTLDISHLKLTAPVLHASYLGYYDFSQKLKFSGKKNIHIDIPLKKSLLNLDQVVVTGTRSERILKNTPVTTQVLHKEQIENSGGSDISTALSEATGVAVNFNSLNTGVNSVELQGLSSDHILVMIDGIKMIGRINGNLDLSQIPSSEIERIEIVKGAASALYGSEAMGGVINIITKKNYHRKSLNLSAFGGSYGRIDANLSASVPIGKWMPSVSLNYRKYDGYDLTPENASSDAPAYNKYQGNFSLVGKLNKNTSINADAFYITENKEVNSSEIFKDKIDNSNLAMRVGGNFSNLFSFLNLNLQLDYSQYNHNFDRIVISSDFVKKGSLTKERLGRATLLFDFKYGKHQINGGYGFEHESLESDRITGGKKTSTLNNIFVQDELDISQHFTILGGIRADIHSVYGSEISPKLTFMYKPYSMGRIRLSYGHGFRAPSFKELYLDYTNISIGYHITGNPDLKPEVSNAIQLDFEFWNKDNYHNRINFFFNQINNLIDYRYNGIIDGFLTYKTMNFNSAKTWGAEIDLRYFPVDWFEYSFGYSYLDTWNAATKSEISLKPKHRLNMSFQFNFNFNTHWNIRFQYIGKKFYWETFDDATQSGTKAWVEGYLLIHTNFNFRIWDGFTADLGIRNITNYVNKLWGPMPGREWYAGIKYKLN